jgi:hypothetical protein
VPGPPMVHPQDNPVHISDVDIDIDMCEVIQVAPRSVEGQVSEYAQPQQRHNINPAEFASGISKGIGSCPTRLSTGSSPNGAGCYYT